MRWIDMLLVAGPVVAEERLKNAWNNSAIAAALICTMAFSGIFMKPEHHDGDWVRSACIYVYGYAIVASFLMSALSVVLAVAMLTRLNMLPRHLPS
jgi:hypothetical protein